jgi:hypothetical protein
MGRPKKQISAKQVEMLAAKGMPNTEIAVFFGVSVDTIDRRFAENIAIGKGQLKDRVRTAQLRAMDQGNSSMLLHLGKVYLGQSDKTIDEYLAEAIASAALTKDDLLSLIKNKDRVFNSQPKKSFEEFCKTAGYPPPFEKQVEMMKFGMDEELARLLLGARGYGKTDYTVILGLAYKIYLNPLKETNLIITKSKERNAAMLREIANACIANGMMFEISNATHLRTVGLQGKDHSVSAVTIKTVTLRGRHPKRVVMDDPVTEDDVSEATRTHVERVYNEVNKLCGNILIIGQPAHKYDLYAKLRGLVKTMEVPHGTIPELDHDLEAQRLAGVDEASIQASYFLKVLSEGTTPFDNVKYMPTFPTGDSSVAWIDPSFKGTDYTALSIIKSHMQGVAVVGFVFKKAWNHCLDEMVPHFKKYNVKKLAIECNSLGDQPVIMLRQLLQGSGIGVVGVDSVLNKHSKIMAAGSYAHLIHLSKESSKVYIDQVVKYEYKAEHDDAPDSLASCLEWIGLIRGKR